jgi:adenosine deaminase CECR1
MAGKRDMSLFGFRQLIEWSIKHSCMDPKTKRSVHEEWKEMWAEFVNSICKGNFGGVYNPSGSSAQASTRSGTARPRGQPGNAGANTGGTADSRI